MRPQDKACSCSPGEVERLIPWTQCKLYVLTLLMRYAESCIFYRFLVVRRDKKIKVQEREGERKKLTLLHITKDEQKLA